MKFLTTFGGLKKSLLIALCAAFGWYFLSIPFEHRLQRFYHAQESIVFSDRNGQEVLIKPNAKQEFAPFESEIPREFEYIVVKKEDRFFWLHPGVNPGSVLRSLFEYVRDGRAAGSSTITQQAVKNILGNENNRTLRNKLIETLYTLALELHAPKREILTAYLNTASFGNQVRGIREAARYYFDKRPEELETLESLSLIATLSNPSSQFPGTPRNAAEVKRLMQKFDINVSGTQPVSENDKKPSHTTPTSFELQALRIHCSTSCSLTLDANLTERLREVLRRNIESPSFASVSNGAIAVLKTGTDQNELLALVGSPNPGNQSDGYQINLALEPRPIGSTIKPFIYLKSFEQGARPYTLVEDREYRYTIGTGYAFYPKNYDSVYRGTVTLHQALSNSLNVPSVKVLEYVGLSHFYEFLGTSLGFQPLQDFENYELGIALGALEMDLLDLTNYFTVFPNEGVLKPLTVVTGNNLSLPMSEPVSEPKQIADPKYVQLVNKILSDQLTRVDQFGLKSNLTLQSKNYALKTGTSRDFHDSWTIGYTPDFVVGVWIGNHNNTPMFRVSGQSGAGKIWHEVMEVMLNSEYNKNGQFNFFSLKEFTPLEKKMNECQNKSLVKNGNNQSNPKQYCSLTGFTESGSIEYGLPEDDYHKLKYAMDQASLILSPHDGDVFLFEPNMTIPLKAKEEVEWTINGKPFGKGAELSWRPKRKGSYLISAQTSEKEKEEITLLIDDEKNR